MAIASMQLQRRDFERMKKLVETHPDFDKSGVDDRRLSRILANEQTRIDGMDAEDRRKMKKMKASFPTAPAGGRP